MWRAKAPTGYGVTGDVVMPGATQVGGRVQGRRAPVALVWFMDVRFAVRGWAFEQVCSLHRIAIPAS